MEILNSLQVTGQVTFGSISIESTSMDVLVSVSGLIKKRTLGSMAMEASANYFTKTESNGRFLQTVGLTAPNIFNTITSADITSPSLAMSLANQTAGTVFAAPAALNGTPSFRALVASDIPALTAYQTVANLSANLTASTTKYPSVTAVNTGLALKANLASPTFTGAPLAPTAVVATNTTQLATTAFVKLVVATGQTLGASINGNAQSATTWGNRGANWDAPIVDIGQMAVKGSDEVWKAADKATVQNWLQVGSISTSGSAATLTNSRTIWGQSFNGSDNVTGNMSAVGNIESTGNWFTSGKLGLASEDTDSDPYAILSVTRGTASNFAYYGMTRAGSVAWQFGIDIDNRLFIGQGSSIASGGIITQGKFALDSSGNMVILGSGTFIGMKTNNAAPATAGVTRTVIVDENGLLSYHDPSSLYLLSGGAVTANQILRLNGSSSGSGIVYYNGGSNDTRAMEFYSSFGSGKGPYGDLSISTLGGSTIGRVSIVPTGQGWIWMQTNSGTINSLMELTGNGDLYTSNSINALILTGNLDWSYIQNKPTIPTNTNQLTNGSGFITSSDLSAYLTATSTHTLTNKSGNISQWTNNSNYITASSSSALTNKTGNISQWTNNSGYITASSLPDLSNYLLKSGGTLTGALSGTSLTLSANLTVGGTGSFAGFLTATGGAGTSDMRHKNKMSQIGLNLQWLDIDRTFAFTFKNDTSARVRFGYSAQEIDLWCTDLVLKDDNSKWALNQTELLILEIKRLKQRAAELEGNI